MFSPFAKTTLSAVKGQRPNKSSPYFSPSIRRSLTPSCSRNSSMSRSFVGPMLDDAAGHLVETYGTSLPVLVTEAITTAERVGDMSVRLEGCGYASLVVGRQLFIWKYRDDGEKSVHCRELPLPPSDLAHRAELSHLFSSNGSTISALCVSPEGHVRYWRNCNHQGGSVDAQLELQGQECCSLTPLPQPLGCILATTSGSLVIITPTTGEGQPGVVCRTLTLPTGVLAGIGRKVSSFIFGSIPAQTSETKQLNRVLASSGGGEEGVVHVLSGSSLQKWLVSEGSDQLLYETDLDRDLKQCFSDGLNDNESNLAPNLKTWCLDMQLCSSGVMILTAGTLAARLGGIVHYAFGIVDSEQSSPKFNGFQLTSYSEPYQEDTEDRLTHLKFLLPTPNSSSAYIYSSTRVLCVQVDSPALHSELDLSANQDVILGSGSCQGVPLFLTKVYGIISFSQKQKTFGDPRLLASMKDVSFRQTDPQEPPSSLSANLRAAMCDFCANDMEKCEKLVQEVLSGRESEGSLDVAVLGLSVGIVDDYPVSDPRWCDSIPKGFVSSSLLISYQLEDKLKTHECLIAFLKAMRLLERLSSCKEGDSRVATAVLLGEHGEKLAAARALRLFLNDHSEVIESAIRDTLDRRNIEIKSHLTAQDVFFREVSSFHHVFPSLLAWEREQLSADESPDRRINAIAALNKICVGLLQSIHEQRGKDPDLTRDTDSPPWTSREGGTGIRHYIREQLELCVESGALGGGLSDSLQVQGVLLQQYCELLDLHLDSYRPRKGKDFERERNHFLLPLLSVQQYERAAAIAEKYLDFDILVQICEETKNADRLQRYMLQFTEQNFTNFVFKWYLDKGQKGRLFAVGERGKLGRFLAEGHESLRWLHLVQEGKEHEAGNTLRQLASKETQFLNRKKTLLSLSKLCVLVSDAPQATKIASIEAINLEQELISHQEALPVSVVEACGIDPRNMRVFTPAELIEMYISEENTTANVYDFKIALDLLGFMKKPMDDPEVYSLRMHIWSKAILRDNWDSLDINNPLDSVKETVFFQIIELAFDQGVDIPSFMPSVDELLQTPELGELTDNPGFRFLLQAGYEHILKITA